MIEIDGSAGGGQVLRLALAFSVLERRPFRMGNIRGSRPNPGLKNQHLTCVELARKLSGAEVSGDEKGSELLEFVPQTFEPRDVKVDIGTAGSVSLLFQTVLPLCYTAEKPFRVKAVGGTDVKWSPPMSYLERVTLPNLELFGADVSVDIERRGFYPKGGGRAVLKLNPSEPEPVELLEREEVQRIDGVSVASHHLKDAKVAERQRRGAMRVLKNALPSVEVGIDCRYVETLSPGSSIVLAGKFGGSVLGADELGERGKRAEKVGRGAGERLLSFMESPAPVDVHMADQVIPFLAVCGGKVAVPEMTDHVRSSIAMVEKFTDDWLEVEEKGEVMEVSVS